MHPLISLITAAALLIQATIGCWHRCTCHSHALVSAQELTSSPAAEHEGRHDHRDCPCQCHHHCGPAKFLLPEKIAVPGLDTTGWLALPPLPGFSSQALAANSAGAFPAPLAAPALPVRLHLLDQTLLI